MLIVFFLSLFVYFRSTKMGIAVRPRYTSAQILGVVKESILTLPFPMILLAGIYRCFTIPTEAAILSLVCVTLIDVISFRKLTVRGMGRVLWFFIVACASTFNCLMVIQEVPMQMSDLIRRIIYTQTMFILALTSFAFVRDCLMDLISLIVVPGTILQSILNDSGPELISFGIICIINCELAFMPPLLEQSVCNYEKQSGVSVRRR
jgi:C4-dicarboxylate transporter DctM subunit